MWLEVIRRFIRSREFKTPFGLQLLALGLHESMQNNESLDLSKEVDKQQAKKSADLNTKSEQGQSSADRNDQCHQAKSSGDSDKDEKGSSTSSSTLLYPENNNECNGADDFNNNSDASSSDTENSWNEEKSPEDEELDRLLQLASSDPCPTRRSRNEEDECEEEETTPVSEPQEKDPPHAMPKFKEPKLSLLDCFSSQSKGGFDGSIAREIKQEDNFVKQFNDEVKNLFLFSSESCQSALSESEREDAGRGKEIKRKRVRKTSTMPGRKRRKNDLYKYRFSTSEDEEEALAKSPKEEKEKKRTSLSGEVTKTVHSGKGMKEGSGGESCDVISDSENSVQVVMETSDSESEILQVDEVPPKSPPNKGRRNINKILNNKSLQLETKLALKTEAERKKRLKEREGLMKKLCERRDPAKLILDFDPGTMQELVVVDENLSKHLKPHQREGVRFMWDSCFESLKRIEEEEGSGCVLAHCMGLGKTLQVIALIHTALTHSVHLRTVLIVCPLIALRNWVHEFKIWMTGCSNPITPFDLGAGRNKKIGQMQSWMQQGGVLVTSYDMFRTLVKKDRYAMYSSWLLDPGPDVVICDEGHLMKNPNSELSKCIAKIRTLRRIVLTGTPLQNNLLEYYCMVQFVKPNLLGTKKEFMNRFVNPITNGQFENSTQKDVIIMKQRSHVLHTLLQSFVQRLGYDVLEPLLPEKQEFVISVALTETQEKMYSLCIKKPLKEGRGLLWDFHWFHKIWTHPLAMRRYFDQNNIGKEQRGPLEEFIPEHEYESIRGSNKLLLLFNILQKCRQIGDKVLVFSQSLYTLGLIENFLLILNSNYMEGRYVEFADSWLLGQDYFKLTGSTKPEDREIYCEKFSSNQRARLFLISTKAGGLGINLVAANRVVLFDASWNPAHDLQSIFRVYRFGQKKPCYIYRFLAASTMEEKIYKRQITKLSLAHRILDEHQIERHYSSDNLLELYAYTPLPKSEWKVPKVPKDEIFAEILSKNRDIIVDYHEHNSLLENKEEEELTEEERHAAWENFEKEKAVSQRAPVDWNFSAAPCEVINKVRRMSEVFERRKRNESRQDFIMQGWNGGLGSKNLLELGDSFGMKPYTGEKMEVYRKRVEGALRTIFPWGTPKVIIQGDVVNEE